MTITTNTTAAALPTRATTVAGGGSMTTAATRPITLPDHGFLPPPPKGLPPFPSSPMQQVLEALRELSAALDRLVSGRPGIYPPGHVFDEFPHQGCMPPVPEYGPFPDDRTPPAPIPGPIPMPRPMPTLAEGTVLGRIGGDPRAAVRVQAVHTGSYATSEEAARVAKHLSGISGNTPHGVVYELGGPGAKPGEPVIRVVRLDVPKGFSAADISRTELAVSSGWVLEAVATSSTKITPTILASPA